MNKALRIAVFGFFCSIMAGCGDVDDYFSEDSLKKGRYEDLSISLMRGELYDDASHATYDMTVDGNRSKTSLEVALYPRPGDTLSFWGRGKNVVKFSEAGEIEYMRLEVNDNNHSFKIECSFKNQKPRNSSFTGKVDSWRYDDETGSRSGSSGGIYVEFHF